MSLEDDPTDFEGLDIPVYRGNLPVLLDDQLAPKKDPRSNAATGATAAGVRAFTAQAVAFYFRAPVKAFFRTRVDYLAYARSLQAESASTARMTALEAQAKNNGPWAWFKPWLRNTTPGLLTHAVRAYGWRVIPEQVMPPLIANVAVGAVLYTSYLQILGRLHEPSGQVRRRVYPPPNVSDTFLAGTLAGAIQSVVAAPLDALQIRYDRLDGHKDRTMWAYGREKLKEIGVRGVFAGWGLSFAKDSVGSGVFFSVFEWVKAQGYYKFVRWYYGALKDDVVDILARKRPDQHVKHGRDHDHSRTIIRPHYAFEPAFLLLAGMSATITQQSILYPLSIIQTRHFERLEELDEKAKRITAQDRPERRRGRMLRAYYRAYQTTWRECKADSITSGSMRQLLFKGFWWHTIRQVPSTSAGLIIFELVRRKYGTAGDEVKINQDGYDILLT